MVTALEGLVVVFVVSLEYMRRRSRATSVGPLGRSRAQATELEAPATSLVTSEERSDL
jgi:hypothetical protein